MLLLRCWGFIASEVQVVNDDKTVEGSETLLLGTNRSPIMDGEVEASGPFALLVQLTFRLLLTPLCLCQFEDRW